MLALTFGNGINPEEAMGLFDKMKGIVKGAQNAVQGQQQAQAPQQPQQPSPPHQTPHGTIDEPADSHDDGFDLAGFDPDNDEESFFHAVLHMESEGQFGGTDESRAEIMHQRGIRDRSHWQTIKESCYSVLAQKYGGNEVSQREMNWRQGEMQKHMTGQVAKAQAGGGFAAVEGVTLEAWAALNAAIVSGGNWEDLLKGARIEKARWDRVSAEWNARMARDTTFAITTVYGNAFQAASKGKFGDYAREATAARAANRELSMQPPMTYEQYYDILIDQAYAAKQGKDPVESLKARGLTIVDWTDLGSFMGYLFNRDAQRNWPSYQAIHQRVEAKYAAQNPGVKPDVDISF
jgi:hypothetical protein